MFKTPTEGSIARCIDRLKHGHRDAAQLVWHRYFYRLVGLARARLRLAAQVAEECRRRLDLLGDATLLRVAQRKLEGDTNAETAGDLGCVESTRERKLQRISGLWANEWA